MFARAAIRATRSAQRSFSTGAVVRKGPFLLLRRLRQPTRLRPARARTLGDFVQDLYLRELKAYKPTKVASQAGATKSYSTPSAPKAPEVPTADALAKELEAYDASSPSVEAPKAAAAEVVDESEQLGADEYLRLCEEPVKVEAKH
ncbi:hypothetical protein JCM10213_000590 [Rhodosporidiobolus nylandii]